MFIDQKILQININGNMTLSHEDDKGCIIDRIPITMANEYSEKQFLESTLKELTKISEIVEVNTRKSIDVIVVGQGLGKTRTIVELRRLGLTKPNILPITITFNGKWKLESNYDKLFWGNESDEVLFGLAIVSRVASVMFGIDFYSTHSFMSANRGMIDFNDPFFTSEVIIRQFLKYIIDIIQPQRSSETQIEHLLFFIDESFSATTYFKSFATIHQTILDKPISNTYNLNAKLYLSSLQVSAIMTVASGRPINPHRVGTLTKIYIVDYNWLKFYNNKTKQYYYYKLLSKTVKNQLYMIATMIQNIPRIAEIFGIIIKRMILNNEFNVSKLTPKMINQLFTEAFREIGSRYPYQPPLPSDKLLYSLLFQETTELNNESGLLIKCSSFINTIIKFPIESFNTKGNSSVITFVPKSDLLMLYLSTNRIENFKLMLPKNIVNQKELSDYVNNYESDFDYNLKTTNIQESLTIVIQIIVSFLTTITETSEIETSIRTVEQKEMIEFRYLLEKLFSTW